MKIEFFEETNFSYRRKQDLEKDLNLHWIARNMAGDKVGDIPAILQVLQHPLTTESEIEKRQQVVTAACENSSVTYQLRDRIVSLSENLTRGLHAILDSRGKHLMEQTMIGVHVETIRELVQGHSEISQMGAKNPEIFKETAFNYFYDSFCEAEPAERLEEQLALVQNLDAFKGNGEIVLEGAIGEGFSLENVEVVSVCDKAKRAGSGIFSGKKGRVIASEEVYQSGVQFANRVVLELLEQCSPFLQQWEEILQTLSRQIIFLAGCARMYERGLSVGFYFCMPKACEEEAEKLYELALALQSMEQPIPNTVSLKEQRALIVTGANQGGKSTFLRSLGIAQVLCQAGMYVPAKKYPLYAYEDIFTHFTRREDATMNMGKFEEELKRMEQILRGAKKNTLILLNESFATTTEVTAYQIAMDLMHTCLSEAVTVWMVTHITKFAKELYGEHPENVLFLSAGRTEENEIRFQMYEKVPGDTSYGLTLYEQMIGKIN